jgi:hypothetical protein
MMPQDDYQSLCRDCGFNTTAVTKTGRRRRWEWYRPPRPSSEQGLLKLKATETYTMTSEESAKRILRLTGAWPKDTREPRGPEHMAKMKAARGPYSDPRDTYIARTIRYAFERSNGKPLSTGQLVKEVYGLQLRVERKPLKSWHYQNVRRALRKVAVPIGRASTRGRSTLWQPIPELLEQRSWVGRTDRKRKRRAPLPLA